MTGMLLTLALVQTPPKFTQVWATRLQTEIKSLIVGERTIYFGTNDSFGSLDQATGKKIWAKSVARPQLGVYVAEGEGKLFANVGQGALWAYDAATGKMAWSAKRTGYASPIASYNQAVYAELSDGKLTALNAGSGKPLWSADLDKGSVSAKPMRYGSLVLVGTKRGTIFAFDKDSGRGKWRYDKANAAVRALVFGDERLFGFFDDGTVVSISLETGQQMWAFYINNGIFGTPLFKDGRVFVTTVGGSFYSLGALNGQQIYKQPLSYIQNFGLSQPLPWRDGFLITDKSALTYLSSEGEKVWTVDLKEDLFGQQPRALGDDLLLTSSHAIMRYKVGS